jgi:hypothetical protein
MYTCDKCGYNTSDSSNFKRHQSRKIPCYLIANNTIKHNIQNREQSIILDVSSQVHSYSDNSFTNLEDNRVRCNACEKILLKNSWKTHQPRCKETPKNTCKFCKKTFAHQPSYSRHKKTCKQKPVPEPEPVTRRFFGSTENVDSYIQRKDYDERLVGIHKRFDILLSLLFFNADHPENQTVRKRLSKSDYIEFFHDNRWLSCESMTAFPKLLEVMGKLAALFCPLSEAELQQLRGPRNNNKQKDPDWDDSVAMLLYDKWAEQYLNPDRGRTNALKDLLYNRTQNGPMSEESILLETNREFAACPNTTTPEYAEFMRDIDNTFSPEYICMFPKEFFVENRAVLIKQMTDTAKAHEVEHFYSFRDGERLFSERISI